MIILEFAVFTPLKRTFDYLPPQSVETEESSPTTLRSTQIAEINAEIPPQISSNQALAAQIGCRFILPFGFRKVMGILLSIKSKSAIPTHKLKPAQACIDLFPILNAQLLTLGLWISDYYHSPIGEVLWMMLPPPLRLANKTVPYVFVFNVPESAKSSIQTFIQRIEADAFKKNKAAFGHDFSNHLKISTPHSLMNPVDDNPPIKTQKAHKEWKLATMCLQQNPLFASDFAMLGVKNAKTLSVFLDKKWLQKQTLPPQILPPKCHTIPSNPLLNLEQSAAVSQILHNKNTFQVNVLEGVTGSGKTEVYLEIAKHYLAEGKQVLILVPEIGLTPQFLARTQQQLGIAVLGLHSQLSNGKRFEIWQAAALNQVQLIIGTRTALFTPLPYLGVIIIDEEHDASYRSKDGIRYSAKDSAMVYAQHLNIPIILGSATPSLETLYNIEKQRFLRVSLPKRAIGSTPKWQLINCSEQIAIDGLTEPLIHAISQKLALNEQVILFLNRRGFAPILLCKPCKWMADCPRCDAHLTLHQNALHCHHCGYVQPKPLVCPNCHSVEWIALGQGTQRIESALQEIFKEETIIRMDRDVINNRQSLATALSQIHNNHARIILGTQMLAKGHDFPNVTLIGIIDTDNLLFSPDYRGETQLAQLLMQVAGRGGRASKPATVLIQTHYPEHPIFTKLPQVGYHQYALQLLEKRALFHLPPFSYQANILADSKSKDLALEYLQNAVKQFERDHCDLTKQIKISPPMHCSMSRRKGLFRAYILLQTHQRKLLNHALKIFDNILIQHKKHNLNAYLDIDPTETL